MSKQLECRVVITYHEVGKFKLGMYDPISGRYEPLGTHKRDDIDSVVLGLKTRMEQAGHRVTYSEITGQR